MPKQIFKKKTSKEFAGEVVEERSIKNCLKNYPRTYIAILFGGSYENMAGESLNKLSEELLREF